MAKRVRDKDGRIDCNRYLDKRNEAYYYLLRISLE